MPELTWIGKEKVVNHHQAVPFRVLERQYTYGGDESDSMVIHGDNLEALKALLPRYEGKIKCIYIDPPYNTAKSSDKNKAWVYSDNVDDPKIKAWIGQIVGDEGEDLSRHDKWLCMMYPRLKLLQKLLSGNGAVFISIDDNELYPLKAICDEIFGANNFVKTFVWKTDGHTDNQDNITGVHEYILFYSKDKSILRYNAIVDPNISKDSKILRDFAENSITKNGFKNPPSQIMLPAGFPCEVETMKLKPYDRVDEFISAVAESGYITRELAKSHFAKFPLRLTPMCVENYKLVADCVVYSGWMNVEKLKKFIENGCEPIVDGDTILGFYLSKNGVIYYHRSGRKSHYIQTVLENMGTTETNKYMIEKMGLKFDYPKPTDLIQYLLSFLCLPGDLVLDSFAGSGTTAHAVLNMNKADGGHRKFILIEMEDYAEDITAERVKRVIDGYGEGKNAVEGTGGNYSYYELGEPLLIGENPNEAVGTEKIREYIWYTETKASYNPRSGKGYYLGKHGDTGYYFYYEPNEITVLSHDFLAEISEKAGGYVIYADRCELDDADLVKYGFTFKKIPRDITRI